MWTEFWDMHSGGSAKEEVTKIYIEAPEREAKIIFYNRFGHNPDRITCSCCGNDYAIDEDETLEEATHYQRSRYNMDTKEYEVVMTVEEYEESGLCWIIHEKDIKPEEREGELPMQGWVWVD